MIYIKDVNLTEQELKYLKLLSKDFKNISEVTTEIINLEAVLTLPKGTEHFLSDIHGEYEAFDHVLKNCSGAIKNKIEEEFGETIPQKEKRQLATVIYYPKQKIELIEKLGTDMNEWYKITINRIIRILQRASSKYTRSKVSKAMTKDFSYIIQELLYERNAERNKEEYVKGIINTIIEIGSAKEFIKNVSKLIQRLVIDNLHIVGDIYDRGPYPDKIIDRLIKYHNVDIQWGNHDILWIGAGSGHEACIANAIRICLRYSNNEVLEEGYGINLLPLARLAMSSYKGDEAILFKPKTSEEISEKELGLFAKMHKAISIIQFKLEGELIRRNPTYEMENRQLLSKINYENGKIQIEGKSYELLDKNFPTIDKENPFELTKEEKKVVDGLVKSFRNSEKLQEHIKFLLSKGSMYLKRNSNLLFHGCIPLNNKGEFQEMEILGKKYSSKELMDISNKICRKGYFERCQKGMDYMWYLWCGEKSPLFGKDQMKTFERYFLEEKSLHKENYNLYYDFISKKEIAEKILKEFGIEEEYSHIINGHIPVKVKKGELPYIENGKVLRIDGGFSKAYQGRTGIAGYTLIFNSVGKRMIAHEAFMGVEKSVEECLEIANTQEIIERRDRRLRVRDTDIGKEIEGQIKELKKLLECYKLGVID